MTLATWARSLPGSLPKKFSWSCPIEESEPQFDEVRDRFADVFVADVVDNQCLSRIRPGVAEQNNRTTEEQFKWEQELQREAKAAGT